MMIIWRWRRSGSPRITSRAPGKPRIDKERRSWIGGKGSCLVVGRSVGGCFGCTVFAVFFSLEDREKTVIFENRPNVEFIPFS